jgi:type VI secretion system protein ImpH
MAGEDRGSSSNLKIDLLKNGPEFSFFQVMRLLRLLGSVSEKPEEAGAPEKGRITIRPELSLAFPAADVTGVEEKAGEEPGFLVGATFLGLYGPSSPLPTFYTEDLLEEAGEDESVARDFVDTINHRLFSLFFRCWSKYRQFVKVVDEGDPRDLERLFCLIGLGEREVREGVFEPYALLRYLGLFTQFPRSALGLKALLQDALRGLPVQILPCVRRKVKIPVDQRFTVGTSGFALGQNTFLGEEIEDRMGKFNLQIGPLTEDQFHSLLPGTRSHQTLAFLTKFYVVEPLEYLVELILSAGEVRPACLGAKKWSALGWDSWVYAGDLPSEVRTSFPPHYAKEMPS